MTRALPPGSRAPAARRRSAAALALAAVIAAGLTVHGLGPDGAVTDITGDALYAVAAFAAGVLIAPRAATLPVAGLAAAWCVGVELLQLTAVPSALAAWFRPIALVLGTGFDARDLVVYVAAVVVAAVIDAAVRSRRAAQTPAHSD